MLLSALLLVATVQVTPSPGVVIGPQARLLKVSPGRASVQDLAAALAQCQGPGLQTVDRRAVEGAFVRLGDLPMANHTLTVFRTQGGCPVSSTSRHQVGR